MDTQQPDSGLMQILAAEHRRLYRIAYSWCCDPALAADLSQQAMLLGLSRLGQLSDSRKLKPWLYAILHNCFLGHLRSQRPNEPIEDLVLASAGAESAASAYERSETVRRVRRAISKLPLGQRQVIALVDLNSCSYAEVAEILDVPIGTVMSRLYRARQALRALIAAEPAAAPRLRLVAKGD